MHVLYEVGCERRKSICRFELHPVSYGLFQDGSDTITGKSLIKKIINEEDTTGEDPTVLIPGEFNKFEEVNSGTNIYYWKTGPADYHYVFDQGEAIISLIEVRTFSVFNALRETVIKSLKL